MPVTDDVDDRFVSGVQKQNRVGDDFGFAEAGGVGVVEPYHPADEVVLRRGTFFCDEDAYISSKITGS